MLGTLEVHTYYIALPIYPLWWLNWRTMRLILKGSYKWNEYDPINCWDAIRSGVSVDFARIIFLWLTRMMYRLCLYSYNELISLTLSVNLLTFEYPTVTVSADQPRRFNVIDFCFRRTRPINRLTIHPILIVSCLSFSLESLYVPCVCLYLRLMLSQNYVERNYSSQLHDFNEWRKKFSGNAALSVKRSIFLYVRNGLLRG